MQSEIQKLLERHCTSLARELEQLELSLAPLSDTTPEAMRPILAACFAQVHKIKGSSGSIGFMEVSAAAGGLEESLNRARSDGHLDALACQDIVDHLGALSSLVAIIRPEDSRFFSFDFSAVAPVAEGGAGEADGNRPRQV